VSLPGALIRALADNTGPTAGLSQALASRRLLVRDRGRVMADGKRQLEELARRAAAHM